MAKKLLLFFYQDRFGVIFYQDRSDKSSIIRTYKNTWCKSLGKQLKLVTYSELYRYYRDDAMLFVFYQNGKSKVDPIIIASYTDRCSLFVDKILLLIGDFFVMEKKNFIFHLL